LEQQMSLNIDVQIPLSAPMAEIVRLARRAEELGFEGMGIPEHLNAGRDVFMALGQVAAATSRITLYPSVTNPVTRHPYVLANLLNTLGEVAPGRAKMALAPGDSAIVPTGRKPATLAEMRNATNAIRSVLRGESVGLDGAPLHTIAANGDPPPVVVTASGPRMTALAAEVGDEAMLMAGLEPRMLALARRHLEIGARQAGRTFEGFRVTHYTLVSIDDDHYTALERARGWLFLWLRQGQYKAPLQELGMQVPIFANAQEISPEWLEYLCRLLFVIGTPSQCAERLRQLEEQGVEHIACLFPGQGELHEATMEALYRIR
jgi:5,10-methylenetetrahydromethanopterin reductase